MKRARLISLLLVLLLLVPLALGPKGNYEYRQEGGPPPSFSYVGGNLSSTISFISRGYTYFAFVAGNETSMLRIVRINDLSESSVQLGPPISTLLYGQDRILAVGNDILFSVNPQQAGDLRSLETGNFTVERRFVVVVNMTIADMGERLQYSFEITTFDYSLEKTFEQEITINSSYPIRTNYTVLEYGDALLFALSNEDDLETLIYSVSENGTNLVETLAGMVLAGPTAVLSGMPFLTMENETESPYVYSPDFGAIPVPGAPLGFLSLRDGSGLYDFDGDGRLETFAVGNGTLMRLDLNSRLVDLQVNCSGNATLVPLDYDWDALPDILVVGSGWASVLSSSTGGGLWRYDAPEGWSMQPTQFGLWRWPDLDLDFDGDGFPEILTVAHSAGGESLALNMTLVSGVPPFDVVRSFSGAVEVQAGTVVTVLDAIPTSADLVGGRESDLLLFAGTTVGEKSWEYIALLFSADKSTPYGTIYITWSGEDLGVHASPILVSEWGHYYSVGFVFGTGISLYGFTVSWVPELPW